MSATQPVIVRCDFHPCSAFIAPMDYLGDNIEGTRIVARSHGWLTADHGEGAHRSADFCPEHAAPNAM
ncbi:hypothetical protein NYS50_05505 [Curtobacterium flaccumfaciens pv. flaccumfaciens]|uniref:hypothetical protein n=1 Tax=Curtobacterium flaccumfaciens TaxID=2035 RepID=UPI00217EA203|nr:hypothetical protein [Curtobacterium flaccumfaciens]MCS6547328.1 hypothetical protein [Curtobacterium flaccumfaciens pv. flaccumfaciens]